MLQSLWCWLVGEDRNKEVVRSSLVVVVGEGRSVEVGGRRLMVGTSPRNLHRLLEQTLVVEVGRSSLVEEVVVGRSVEVGGTRLLVGTSPLNLR